jgi:hypothetical protein
MGWNRERERRGFKGGGQQGRAPPELAESWPAAEVERRAGGRRQWDLELVRLMWLRLGLSGGRRGAGWVEGGAWGWGIFRVNFGRSMEVVWMARIVFEGLICGWVSSLF